MKIYLVIPTYNEKNNILKLLEEILALEIPDLNILVVDDNSPDGTGNLVEEFIKNHPAIEILHREKKQGLGKAYVAGFKEVLRRGADLIFEMDADFSHQPKYLPDFLAAIKNNDLILGSRYIVGGGVKNWSIWRHFISFLGNFYARIVLQIPIKDLTGGFKCFRREVLETIGLDSLSSVGYNFQIETTFLAHQRGFKIEEIPIVFLERERGQSKFNLQIVLESFWQVLKLKFRKFL